MPDTAAVVESSADLVSSVPADLFSSVDTDTSATQDTSSDTTDTFETPESIEGDTGTETDTPNEGEAEEGQQEGADTAQPQTSEQQQTQTEELPEGVVRGKDRNGKPGLFVEDSRWKTIYGNHQMVQRVSEMLGEPATPEALQLRNDAYMAQERLFNDLNSGDAQSQTQVLNYVLDEMARAREEGEVGVDPAVPFAQSIYTTLRDRNPDAYATLRMQAARDLVGEMFQEAAASGDDSLWLSAQHFARALANVGKDVSDIAQVRAIAQRMGIPFYAKAEMQGLARGGNDVVSRLQAENARLSSLVSGKSQTTQAAQFDQWFNGLSNTVKSSILDQAIKPALSTVEASWKEFPNDYQDLVVDRLHRKVTETIKADTGFNEKIRLLDGQARRAASAQKRDEIGRMIQQAYVNRAKLAVDAVKRPILEFAANRLKERADQTHARRSAAQNRTVPKGSTGTVPRSLVPNGLPQMKDGVFDPATAVQQARQLLG